MAATAPSMTEPPFSGSSAAQRKILQTAVACLCSEAGFDSIEPMALETLAEIIQSCEFYPYFDLD